MALQYKRYGFETEEALGEAVKKMHEAGQSQKQVAQKLSCSRLTVIKMFKHYDIKSEDHHVLYKKCGYGSEEEFIEAVKNLYEKGLSQREIAKHFGVSLVSMSRCFQKHSISVRTNSEAIGILQRDVILNDSELELISGLLLGNGFLKRNKYTASLHYSCLHKEAIETITHELNRLDTNYRFRKLRQREWYQIRTMSYMCLADLYDKWYASGRIQIPDGLELTPEACYWWYVGDGSTMPEALKLFTGLTEEEDMVKLLEQFPVEATWYKAHNQYPTLYVPDPKDRIKFLRYIGPCRHETYSYKWRIYAGNKVVADLSTQA
jgi:transcriptional regulator with XRE-family HTH domain